MGENILAQVKGLGGFVYVYSDRVVISRKSITGFLYQGLKGDKTIYFKDMKSIEYKKPSGLVNGYIQFVVNPELAKNQSIGIFGTSYEATKDPNALILRAYQKETVSNSENVYRVAMQQWEKSKSGQDNRVSVDPADEIAKYKKLADDGTITQEEFETKKKQLLNL